jgi:hypothetical protein
MAVSWPALALLMRVWLNQAKSFVIDKMLLAITELSIYLSN